MYLKSLTAHHFRNLSDLSLDFQAQFNVFCGDNGQGKTNILEAIYLLATLRSFRTSSFTELITLDEKNAFLKCIIEQSQVTHTGTLELVLDKTVKKTSKIDGKSSRGTDYFKLLRVVFFGPEDLQLVVGSKSLRRRFLDRAVWNLYPAYLDEVRIYERVLQQRNALLKTEKNYQLLEVYNQQFIDASIRLIKRRQHYLSELFPYLLTAISKISGQEIQTKIIYKKHHLLSDNFNEEELKNEFQKKLNENLTADFYRGYTSIGPHTDDIEFFSDHLQFGLHTSQGQNRTLVLALKIAEIILLNEKLETSPLFLLDDVSSELDPDRNRQLFLLLKDLSSQTFITTTRRENINLGSDREDFFVKDGKVSRFRE